MLSFGSTLFIFFLSFVLGNLFPTLCGQHLPSFLILFMIELINIFSFSMKKSTPFQFNNLSVPGYIQQTVRRLIRRSIAVKAIPRFIVSRIRLRRIERRTPFELGFASSKNRMTIRSPFSISSNTRVPFEKRVFDENKIKFVQKKMNVEDSTDSREYKNTVNRAKEIFSAIKLGILFGFFVDAFKVGS